MGRHYMADYATQDGHNEEGPANDSDAASPAGHVFAMIHHVGNARGQQSHGHAESKNPYSKRDRHYGVVPLGNCHPAQEPDEKAQRAYAR